MIEEDVTLDTRNGRYVELKLAGDVIVWVATMYLITHPDAFDRIGDIARDRWRRVVHGLSVWTARQDIRSLPETED